MTEKTLRLQEVLDTLPAPWPEALLPVIQARVRSGLHTLVVLDDDPTGTQTVHGVPVLTNWDVETLRAELASGPDAFYLLTNSRSMSPAEASALNAEIGRNLARASKETGRRFVVASRSDSTLRGHFPEEVEALERALGQPFDAWLLIPFFQEGGRYTLDDVHYVAEGDRLVPAAETEFARDVAFGYRASNLRDWVEEKSKGRIPAESVASISIEAIRQGGPSLVTKRLLSLSRGSVCVVNAADYRDLEVFTLGLLDAEAAGRRFLYRTAASFVAVRAGISRRPLLQPEELNLPKSGGGLVVVGSHVPKTTGQVTALLSQTEIVGIEISTQALLSEPRREAEIARVAAQAEQALRQDRDVVLYTSRRLIAGNTPEESLSIGKAVSDGLVAIVRRITLRPRYLLAKGGITSSDLATEGLNIKRALVLGQILPGVPVWQAGPESRYPGLAVIVFPGNVGGPNALAEVVLALRRRTD